eukprot:6357793-Pyramimonas_sp.AAC.1
MVRFRQWESAAAGPVLRILYGSEPILQGEPNPTVHKLHRIFPSPFRNERTLFSGGGRQYSSVLTIREGNVAE